MSSRQLEEMQEKSNNLKLAKELGISYEELLLLEREIDENASDDGLVYELIVTFSKESPRKILSKISGLEDGYTVRLSSSFFDDEEDFEQE